MTQPTPPPHLLKQWEEEVQSQQLKVLCDCIRGGKETCPVHGELPQSKEKTEGVTAHSILQQKIAEGGVSDLTFYKALKAMEEYAAIRSREAAEKAIKWAQTMVSGSIKDNITIEYLDTNYPLPK